MMPAIKGGRGRYTVPLVAYLLVELGGAGSARATGTPQCAYVANSQSDLVSVIDTATNRVTRSIRGFTYLCNTELIPPSSKLDEVVATADGCFVYITSGACTLYELNTAINEVENYIPVGTPFAAAGAAVLPDDKFVYAAQAGGGILDVVATATQSVIAKLTLANPSLSGVAAAPSGKFVYVTSSSGSFGTAGFVSVIDTATNSVATTLLVGRDPESVTAAPDGNVYVSNWGDGTVSVIDSDTNTVRTTVPTEGGLYLAASPDGTVYLTQCGAGICTIDTATEAVTGSIPLSGGPNRMAFTADGAFAYVTVTGEDAVAVIRTTDNTVQAMIPLPDCGQPHSFAPCAPVGIAIPPVGHHCAYCAGDCDNSGDVSVGEILAGVDIILGAAPVDSCPAFDANNDGRVTIDEILRAVGAVLNGCPAT